MTGIERLRQMAVDFKSVKTAEHCTFIVNTWRGRYIDDAIADIADQIEREQACDSDTAENVRLVVGGVITDMERHVSGAEGAEDSPVARWARELRKALGGGERDHAADVSMSAYDLLPPDEREAIAWVREHGGLERVKQRRYESIPRAAYERKRRALLGHIAECETALGKRREAIARLADENDALRLERAQMRPRLMPEGMEWPCWDDGKPVTYDDSTEDAIGVFLALDGSCWAPMDAVPDGWLERGESLDRPAKVLDADGVEIRVGDYVWDMGGNGPYEVVRFTEEGYVRIKSDFGLEQSAFCERLTHRAPVIAADGRPLREGETVWDVDGGGPYEVEGFVGKPLCVMLRSGVNHEMPRDPSKLTHERPDSWGRLEDDIAAGLMDTGETVRDCREEAKEFVRRAKALAERDA